MTARDSTGDRLCDEAYDRRGKAYYDASFARASVLCRATSAAEIAAAESDYRQAIRRADEDYRADTSYAASRARET